jgi:hypothetical protein
VLYGFAAFDLLHKASQKGHLLTEVHRDLLKNLWWIAKQKHEFSGKSHPFIQFCSPDFGQKV